MGLISLGSAGSRTVHGSNLGRKRSTSSCPGTSTRSTVWERMKPSRHTITGRSTRLSSASRKAISVASKASWLSSTYTWSQPESRSAIESLCSTQMPAAAPSERFTLAMTMGNRHCGTAYSISCISASPWEDVAVNARTPPALAPMAMLMAECSLSAGMKSASSSPSLMNSANRSTMSVCGVIGNAGTTSVLASLAA